MDALLLLSRQSHAVGHKGAGDFMLLEEIIHSVQNNLQRLNKEAVIQVNEINEELAKTILKLDDKTVTQLTEYLQLQLLLVQNF